MTSLPVKSERGLVAILAMSRDGTPIEVGKHVGTGSEHVGMGFLLSDRIALTCAPRILDWSSPGYDGLDCVVLELVEAAPSEAGQTILAIVPSEDIEDSHLLIYASRSQKHPGALLAARMLGEVGGRWAQLDMSGRSGVLEQGATGHGRYDGCPWIRNRRLYRLFPTGSPNRGPVWYAFSQRDPKATAAAADFLHTCIRTFVRFDAFSLHGPHGKRHNRACAMGRRKQRFGCVFRRALLCHNSRTLCHVARLDACSVFRFAPVVATGAFTVWE